MKDKWSCGPVDWDNEINRPEEAPGSKRTEILMSLEGRERRLWADGGRGHRGPVGGGTLARPCLETRHMLGAGVDVQNCSSEWVLQERLGSTQGGQMNIRDPKNEAFPTISKAYF